MSEPPIPPVAESEWVETWALYRSDLDHRVWVPLENGSDTAGVYLAGGIKRVKEHLAFGLEPGRFRWVRHDDRWIGLEVLAEHATPDAPFSTDSAHSSEEPSRG